MSKCDGFSTIIITQTVVHALTGKIDYRCQRKRIVKGKLMQ